MGLALSPKSPDARHLASVADRGWHGETSALVGQNGQRRSAVSDGVGLPKMRTGRLERTAVELEMERSRCSLMHAALLLAGPAYRYSQLTYGESP